ncbi:MAG: CCA tRNA nucleotidyltransferase [Eubacteriales bacterium]|nr:CCA tRNA nucleotidyltransferase [Eubacteriales bacterium]
MSEISPPKYVKAVLKTLNAHEYPACIVGGCVRDAILGVEPQDWDVATGALPAQVMELFPDCIPTGVKHGTVTVRSFGQFVEVTTFRSDGEYADHRHPDKVSFVGDLTADLSRRDFTINAIAVTSEGTVVDPYHGIDDIFSGMIKCVGDPGKRFEEDALRMLRAFRFSSRFGFPIEEKTFCAIREKAPLVFSLSAERIRDELEKILLTSNPEILYTVIDCGLLDGYIDKHLSRDDGLIRIAVLNKKPLVRWALFCMVLLADECIADVRDFLTSLRLDGRTVRCCSDCCDILKVNPPENNVEWKQLLRKYGVDTVECAASCWGAIYEQNFQEILKRIMKSGECFSLHRLAINGNDLISSGFDGKEIGEMLNRLLDIVIEAPEKNTREILLKLASTGIKNS